MAALIRRLWNTYKDSPQTWIILSGVLLCFSILASALRGESPVAKTSVEDSRGDSGRAGHDPLDRVPAGYVLVPIDPFNGDALDGVLGASGVVDLYLPSEDARRRAEIVAKGIPILRAPLNPQRVAVLVKEEEAAALVRLARPLIVVVKNRAYDAARNPGKVMATDDRNARGNGSNNEFSRVESEWIDSPKTEQRP